MILKFTSSSSYLNINFYSLKKHTKSLHFLFKEINENYRISEIKISKKNF